MRRHRWWMAGLAALALLKGTFFVVDETQMAIVTQFGRPLYTLNVKGDEAGLHAKWPFQGRRLLDRRLLIYNPLPTEFLTLDKKNLIVDNFVVWRIADPVRFLQAVGDIPGGEARLHDLVRSEVFAALGQTPLEALVSVDVQKLHLDDLMAKVTEQCRDRALREYGIEIVDVRIKRLNLPEQNKQSVFARMRAERERMAKQYRAEGEEQALKIRAEADKERTRLMAEAYRRAQEIRGQGDAEAARIYAQAYQRDPSLYRLLRTLETYQKSLNEGTTVILSGDSDFLRLLIQGQKALEAKR